MTANSPTATYGTAIAPTPQNGSGPNRTLRIVLLVIGSGLLIAAIVSAAIQISWAASYTDQSETFEADEPVETISINTAAVDVEVTYGDVQSPVFEYDHRRPDARMTQELNNGEWVINVRPTSNFGPRFDTRDLNTVVLTLPQDYSPADLNVDVTAGSLEVEGNFGDVDIRTTAATTDLEGSVEDVAFRMTAGRLYATNLDVSGDVFVSATAGEISMDFVELPQGMDVDVTGGETNVAIPRGEYQISASAMPGTVRQEVDSTSGADRHYRFSHTAGDLNLTYSD